MLTFVKGLHTVVWAFLVLCILGIFVAAHRERFGLVLVLAGIVTGEVLVLVANRMRCPLTDLAARHTSERAANFDIFLPLWLARYNKEIFGPLFVLAVVYAAIRWLD